jgi:hypothetical protein
MKKLRNLLMKNFQYLCIVSVIALGLMTIVGTGGGDGGGDSPIQTCVDVSGTWNTTELEDATGCGEGTYTNYNEFTITQSGCNISVDAGVYGTHSGTVNGSQITYTGSYPEEGGTTTINVNLTISGNSLNGSATWTWSDGTYSCSGSTQITGTRSADDSDGKDPTADITSPTGGSSYTEGDTITFSGIGSDPEDGTLIGSSLVWTSSIDGQIGTGTSFTKSSLSTGTHTITLTATDSDGANGTDSVSITVNPSGNECDGPVPCLTTNWGNTYREFIESDQSPILILSTGTIFALAGVNDEGHIFSLAGDITDCYNGVILLAGIDLNDFGGIEDSEFFDASGNAKICGSTLTVTNLVIDGVSENNIVATYVGTYTAFVHIASEVPPEILFETMDKLREDW